MRVENQRQLSMSTLVEARDPVGMLVDTFDCVIAELEKTHTIPRRATVTIRVEFDAGWKQCANRTPHHPHADDTVCEGVSKQPLEKEN